MDIQKPAVFLYTNNEQSVKEIKPMPFIMVSKRIKHLGINLHKEVKTHTRHCRMKLKKTWTNGKTFNVHKLEDSVLL